MTLCEDTAPKRGQIHRLILLLEEQKLGSMTFSIPAEMKNNAVNAWKDVTFDTKITKWSRTDKLTVSGLVTPECLLAMNEVLSHWKKPLEFFFEGHQQTIN